MNVDMFYKFTLSFDTYKTLDTDDICMLNSNNLTYEEYPQFDGSILTAILIVHPYVFACGDFFFNEYEPWYVKQLEKYGNLLKKIGFNEISIFFELFCIENTKGEFPQCNFEIFNSSILKKFSNYNISIPISVYSISKEQAMEYLNCNPFCKDSFEENQFNNSMVETK